MPEQVVGGYRRPGVGSASTLTFCPLEKLIGQATDINDGIAGVAKGVAAAPRRSFRATATVMGRSCAAWANCYGHPDGRRFNSPPPAWAVEPSRGISLLKAARQNKGLHRTAHKLPILCGFATITPVEPTRYCACALPVSPDVQI